MKIERPLDRSNLVFDCEYIFATRGIKWALKYLDIIESRPKIGIDLGATEDGILYRKEVRDYIKSLNSFSDCSSDVVV